MVLDRSMVGVVIIQVCQAGKHVLMQRIVALGNVQKKRWDSGKWASLAVIG